MRINIKPLSVNKAFQGRRFKTSEYKQYERDVLLLLSHINIPKGKLFIELTFGFSNKGSDVDNPVKLFIDILQKKFSFNDSQIYKMILNKVIVKKGMEYINFQVKEL